VIDSMTEAIPSFLARGGCETAEELAATVQISRNTLPGHIGAQCSLKLGEK